MAKFKPYKIESSQLNDLTKAEGQFIVTTDTKKIYLDKDNSNRIELGGKDGTVTSVATGAGLTGGTITNSGTIKANLKSETKSTLAAADMGSTANRQYAVGIDKNDKLSVNIPWTDNNTTYSLTQDGTDGHKITLTPSTGTAQTVTIPDNNTTYSLTQDSSDGHKITLTPSSGTAQTITIPDNNTTYTFATGDNNGEIKVTPSGGSAQGIAVKGLNNAAYKDIDSSISAASTSTKLPTSQAVASFVEGKGYTSNTGTITKVQANGTDVASSGTANIPAASTSAYGVTELSSATDSTSESLAATPKAVKAAYDLAASKGTGTITGITMNGTSKGTSGVVDLGTVITSHQSIKTINNNTITGTGNVSVGTITGVSVNGTSVATSGTANITSVPASILSGAIPSAVTATTQTQGNNSTKIATTAYVDTAIDNLPEPMVFKGSLGTGGTITALPVDGTATVGDTYKVITDGTYASKAAKVGDTFICDSKTSSANTWTLIPSGDEPSGTVTSVTIKATSPIAIDSSSAITTSGTRTLSHANSGVTAGTYKSVTVNATGHVTAGTNPTTISGYGITDAKIDSGVITLGSNTITPLTASSTLDATKLSGTIPSGCYTNTKNTAGSTDTSSKIYLIGATSQAANPQTYSDDQVYATNGTLQANKLSATAGVNANTGNYGAQGGLSLYGSDPEEYGITMRQTGTSSGNLGKHGYVQGDWATYFTTTNGTNRGWIYRYKSAQNNVASISAQGNAVFNGSVTIGGNAENTSGARIEYNSTNQSIEFNFN